MNARAIFSLRYAMAATGVLALLAIFSLGACNSHSHDDNDDHVAEEACAHMKNGPDSAITATASLKGAPGISKGHLRYTISMTGEGDAKTGYVTYTAAKAEDYRFFLSQDIPLVFSTAGAVVAPEKMATNVEACSDLIKADYTVELAAATYTLTFGPTSASTVQVVVEADHGDSH